MAHQATLLCRWFVTLAGFVALSVYPLAAGAGDFDSTMQRQALAERAARTDQLIVRARAGLRPHIRRQLLAEQGTEEVGGIEALGASIIRVPRGRLATVARALRRSRYFKSVERDYSAVADQMPNDPELGNQWGLSKVGALTAWNTTLGSSGITVAIVDSGIDETHPDLRNQVVAGYDFVHDSPNATDDNGHGTRMAGVVAAQAFNRIGIAGVAPNCRLMPIKVLGADAFGSYSAIASGIIYAADHGAQVINLSLAGTAPGSILESAVAYATARGVVVVASAGNFGTGDPAYPAAYSNVVAVSATDESDTVANFSSYGSWVTLAAPGVDILTTNWTGSGGPAYIGSSGTSPAAAFVSGAVALVLSAHPELSSTSAVALLTASARDLNSGGWDPYAGWGRVDIAAALNSSAPNRTPTPSPAVSAQASGLDRSAPTVRILSPANNSVVSGDVAVDVTAQDDVGVVRVVLTSGNRIIAIDTAPPFGFVWDSSTAKPGKHTLKARAYDAVGHVKVSNAVKVVVM